MAEGRYDRIIRNVKKMISQDASRFDIDGYLKAEGLTPGQFKQIVEGPSIGGQIKEGFKGLLPGAVGLVESAAIGASALLPDEYEAGAREAIESAATAAKRPFAAAPGYEDTVGRKLGEAVGSTIPFLAAGPLGLAGRVGAVGLGVGAGAGEARTRAEEAGATEEQRAQATALGIAPGALEVFAPFRILKRLDKDVIESGVDQVRRALVAGGEEAAQEAASGFAQNLIARGIYKPEQELIEGLGEQAAYGGATGAIVQGLLDLAIGRRARGTAEAPAETPPTEPAVGVPPTATQASLFTEEEAPEAITQPPAEGTLVRDITAAQAEDMRLEERTAEGVEAQARVDADMLRDQFDTLEREVARLNTEYPTATPERQQEILKQVTPLIAARDKAKAQLQNIERRLPKEERGRVAAAPEQMGLDFEAPEMFRRSTPEGKVLGEEPEAPAGLSPEQKAFFEEQRIQSIRSRMDAGEMVTPAEMERLRQADREAQAAAEAAPTPEIAVKEPIEKRLGFALTPETGFFRDASGRLRREGEVPEAAPEVETRLITEDDFKAMGIGSTNKKLREQILGKDITKPKQRAAVRQALEDYANNPNRSARIVEGVQSFLSTGPFMEQTRLDLQKRAPEQADLFAEETVDVTEPGRTDTGAGEPSVPPPDEGGAPAGEPQAPVVSGVGEPGGRPAGADVGERAEPRALDPKFVYAAKRAYDKERGPDSPKWVNLSEEQRADWFDTYAAESGKSQYKRTQPYRVGEVGVKGQSKQGVEALVKRLTAGWANAPKIEVVQSVQDLPQKILEDVQRDKVNPKGAFNPSDQKVYLVADNLTGYADTVVTVAHEAIGHFGLRSVLGAQYTRTMEDLYANNAEVRSRTNKKIKEGLDKALAVEEVIAEVVETETGMKPASVLGRAVQRIINLVRNFLQRLGVGTVNDATIRDLIAQAKNYVVEGQVQRGEGTAPDTGTAFRKNKPQLTAEGQKAQAAVKAMEGISNEKPKQPTKGLLGTISSAVFDKKERQDFVDKLRVQVAYKGASVERKLMDAYNGQIRDALGNPRPDIYMTSAEHSDTLTVAVLKLGKLVLNKNIGWEAVQGSASMFGVMDKIKKLGERLGDYNLAFKLANDAFIARRANALKNLPEKDIVSLPDQAKIDAGLQAFKDFPELEAAFKEFTDFKNGLIDAMVEGGRISKDQAESWKNAADYVPWNRIKEYEEDPKNSPQGYFKGLTNLRNLKQIKGGEEQINNIFDNMVGLSFWMTNSAIRNHAGIQLTDAFVKNNLGAKRVREGQPGVDPNKTIFLYRDGKREFYEFDSIADVYAFRGIESMGAPLLKSFTAISNLLRKTTTAMPQFAFSQLFQDSYRAMTMSGVKNPFTVGAKVIKGYISSYRGDPTTNTLERLGIVGMYDLIPGRAQEEIEKEFGIRQKSVFGKGLEFMESFSIASDAALRKAVFEQTLKETKSAQFPEGDVLLARYRAQEVINFKRQGVNRTVGLLRQVIPFMNAYIQGMDVFYRSMTGRGIAAEERAVAARLFWGTGAKLAALSMIYAMAVGDDEEYEGLRDYEKDKNFILPGGVKIPVAPEVGLLFKVIPERTYRYIASQGTETPEDAASLKKAIGSAMFDAISGPNLTPQAIKPLLEVGVNYSFFTGSPIVGRGMENVAASQQFTSSTSEIAKMIGGIGEELGLGISPLKVDYLMKGFTGIAGGTLLDITNAMVADRPDRRLYELPLFKTFMYDKIPGGYKEQYYDFRNRVDEVADTINMLKAQGRTDELEKYMTDERLSLLAYRRTLNRIDQKFEDMRRYKRIVAEDPTMTGEEKRSIIDEIEQSENELLKAYNIREMRKAAGL